MCCSNGWTLWLTLAECIAVMIMEATLGGLFIVAKREKLSVLGTSPHPKRMNIFSSFEVQTTGKTASQFRKENMISRA